MHIKIPYKYTEEVIPKCCRKPRRVGFHGEMTLTIHEVLGEEAPIAIREHTSHWADSGSYEPTIIEYRWWGKKLWVLDRFNRYSHGPYEIQTADQFKTNSYPMEKGFDRTWYNTRQQTRCSLMSWARDILFIDGMRWKHSGEPRYVIMTFGLGHNHGNPGTSLSSDNHYNSNISKHRYFPIDQHDLALTTAIAIAERRGDDQAVPFIKDSHETFDILIPEAVRLNPGEEHGDGDSFINKMEGMIEAAPDALVAGLMVIHEGMKVLAVSGDSRGGKRS